MVSGRSQCAIQCTVNRGECKDRIIPAKKDVFLRGYDIDSLGKFLLITIRPLEEASFSLLG